MKKIATLGLVGLLALGTFGCNVKSEKVIQKEHQPEEIKLIVDNKGPNLCYDDEDFILTLQRGGKVRDVYVTQHTYNSVKQGERIDMTHIQYETKDPDDCAR